MHSHNNDPSNRDWISDLIAEPTPPLSDAALDHAAEPSIEHQPPEADTTNPGRDDSFDHRSGNSPPTTTFAQIAQPLVQRGIPVIPVQPRDKACKLPNWPALATTNAEQIERWNKQNPRYNCAAVAKPDGIWILDCDQADLPMRIKEATGKKLPLTYAVKSSKGFHFYFEQNNTSRKMGNVKVEGLFDAQQNNKYVVAAGSVHPSGVRYEALNDAEIVPAPDWLVAWIVETADKNTKTVKLKPTAKRTTDDDADDDVEIVHEGGRDNFLYEQAWRLRNAGLSPTVAEIALHKINTKQCVPPMEPAVVTAKIRSAFNNDRRAQTPVVETDPEPVSEPDKIPAYPPECIDGDLIGALTHLLSDGTAIPPVFMRENIKVILGALLDGKVGFPGEEDLHARQYGIQVSPHPESGKGTSWRRLADPDGGGALLPFVSKNSGRNDRHGNTVSLIDIVPGTLFGSGELLVKHVKEYRDTIARFDEMSSLFLKDQVAASTLEQKFLELFEGNTVATGSIKNGKDIAQNVHFSVSGDFTVQSFTSAFAGRGSIGSGFLSRCVLSFADKVHVEGDWPEINREHKKRVLMLIEATLNFVDNESKNGLRFIPHELDDARELRLQFFKELRQMDRRYTGRLEAHMKRDLLLRAVFSKSSVIDAEMVKRSIAWGRYQLAVRTLLWPDDAGTPVERMERKILDVLHKRLSKVQAENPDMSPEDVAVMAGLTQTRLADFCNVGREGSGGREVFGRALKALSQASREIKQVGKTRKGSWIWGMAPQG